MTLIFGQDEPFLTAIDATSRDFLERTREHWFEWARNLAAPFEWQSAVIRAAITLKLTSFRETGAIVAAHTTSIPEAPMSTRNWDYRFCWLQGRLFRRRRAEPARRDADHGILHQLHHDDRHRSEQDSAGARHRAVLVAGGDASRRT